MVLAVSHRRILCGSYGQVTRSFAQDLREMGGEVHLGHEVIGFASPGVGDGIMEQIRDSTNIKVSLHRSHGQP